MLEAIERATRYTKGMTLEAFVKDEMVCDAVMRNIQSSVRRPTARAGLFEKRHHTWNGPRS